MGNGRGAVAGRDDLAAQQMEAGLRFPPYQLLMDASSRRQLDKRPLTNQRLVSPCGDFERVIPVIPFFVKFGSIRETGETVPEVQKVLATRLNTGYHRYL